MKREDIEKAAEECRLTTAQSMGVYGQYHSIDECPEHGLSCDELVEGSFIKGAEWRINSVWHDASERPDTDKGDLLVIVKDAFGKDVYVRQNAYYVLKYGCVRWAYIKDLIPNNEHFKV